MHSLRLHSLSLQFRPPSAPAKRVSVGVCCGLRGSGTRPPLWRSHVMSSEAIQAVQALKFSKTRSSGKVFDEMLGRLVKVDQLAVLAELRRQNEWELAFEVFRFIQKEVWYKPDLSLYGDMILMLGKNKMFEMAEELFSEISKGGLQPDTRSYTEMIGACFQGGMVERAIDFYKSMKAAGCKPDKLTFAILIRNLEIAGEENLASDIKKECAIYLDYPEKFLEEIDKKYRKRRSVDLV